jgi:hypothetical protein
MAEIKKPLSQHSREELARNLGLPWMQELIENMRYAATFAERSYTSNTRTISEVEHQALNGSFREGAAMQVERILILAQNPKPAPEMETQAWGALKPLTPNPSAYVPPIKPVPTPATTTRKRK